MIEESSVLSYNIMLRQNGLNGRNGENDPNQSRRDCGRALMEIMTRMPIIQ